MLPLSLIALTALLFAATSLCFAESRGTGANVDRLRVYLGTASKDGSKGIYLASLDLQSGKLSEPKLIAEVEAPSFLAVQPNGKWMYSVGSTRAEVHAFAIKPDGGLELLNTQPAGDGRHPCHISVEPGGRGVLVANYASGSIAALPIEADGRLAPPSATIQHEGTGPNTKRQEGPHAHAIHAHPAAPYAFAADLGADRLFGYRYDAQAGTLEPDESTTVTTAPGAGPRHFAFHPTLNTIYLINELDSTVMTLRFDSDTDGAGGAGRLETLQTLTTLPADFTDTNYPSEVAVHPSGRFLYGANRGHDSIAVFNIDATTGQLTPAGHVSIEGEFPRHFAIDPTGRYLIAANQFTNDLSVFELDQKTGTPRFTSQKHELGAPMCVLYMPEK